MLKCVSWPFYPQPSPASSTQSVGFSLEIPSFPFPLKTGNSVQTVSACVWNLKFFMCGFRGDIYLEVDMTVVSLPGFGPRLHRTPGDFLELEPHARDCSAGWRLSQLLG